MRRSALQKKLQNPYQNKYERRELVNMTTEPVRVIRLAKRADVERILEIYRPYIEHTPITFEYSVPSLFAFRERFDRITARFPWLVCEVDGVVAGYAYAELPFERAAYQWNADIAVYIAPQYHRMKIASAFYKCIEQILELQGYYHLYACITETNETSAKFHRALGFQEFANFKNSGYKMGRWHDVIWFVKQLKAYKTDPEPPVPYTELPEEQVRTILEAIWDQL